MTYWLTYGDRMSTKNHDIERIKESFFLQTFSTTLLGSGYIYQLGNVF